jgi:hypothetical protein
MRTFIGLMILFGLFLAVDAVLLNGRYRDALWRDAKRLGETFNGAVHTQFHRLGL